MAETLDRFDIVGRPIEAVYRSLWDEDPDGFAGCTGFVELKDGKIFELQGVDFGEFRPIILLDKLNPEMTLRDLETTESCKGKTILEVVACDQWPSIGLELTDSTYLAIVEREFRRVGPCFLDSANPRENRIGQPVRYWRLARSD